MKNGTSIHTNGNGTRPKNGAAPTNINSLGSEFHWDALSPNVNDALRQPLDAALVSERKGRGGRRFSYIEGHTAIDQANQVFGYGGWGYELVGDVTLREFKSGAAYSATVRVTVPAHPLAPTSASSRSRMSRPRVTRPPTRAPSPTPSSDPCAASATVSATDSMATRRPQQAIIGRDHSLSKNVLIQRLLAERRSRTERDRALTTRTFATSALSSLTSANSRGSPRSRFALPSCARPVATSTS